MNYPTIRKILYVDSQQQLTSTNNVFTLNVDSDLTDEYDMCSLISAQIPVSFYIIQTGGNTITLLEGSQSVIVTIPEGNYSVYSFQASVGPLLTAASPNGYTYTILFNNIFNQVDTGKLTFQCSSTANIVGFQFPPNNAISEPFGFFPGTTNYFVVNGPIQTLQSKNVISFIPESSIFIHANFVQGSSQSGFTDVLACIFSSNAAPYSTINYVNPQIYETAKKTCNLSRVMVFSITDEFGNAIFCNGGNIILQILLYKTPESMNNVNSLIEKYISMRTNLFEHEYNEKAREQQKRLEESQNELQYKNDMKESMQLLSSKFDTLINLFNTLINKDGSQIENQTTNPSEFENQNQTLFPGEDDIVPRE